MCGSGMGRELRSHVLFMRDAVNIHGSLYCAPFFYICSVCGMYM